MNVITDNLDLWTSAILTKTTAGRGSNGKQEAYGIKKLRELILELAITGRLLGNDTSGWTNAMIGEIGDWGSGGTPLKAHAEYYGGDIPWLVIGDLNDGLVTEAQTYITQLGLEKSSAHLVPEGTLLIAIYGSIGKLGIAGIPCATNQAIAFCIPDSEQIETQYLFFYLRAIREHLLSRGQGLAQQNISQKILKATSIKLPRLEEQHRIVAKVDELMALCDQLEQQQTNSIEAHQTLVETLLGTLVRPEPVEGRASTVRQAHGSARTEFEENWTRIADNFDILFITEQSIDQLKQTILQLAVMGRLVPQDPKDEPASVLLEKITKEKKRLIKEGKIKKQEPLPEISEEKRPFELPQGWEWVPLGSIASFENGDRSSRYPNSNDLQEAGIPFFGAPDMVDGVLRYDNGLRFISEDKFNELSNGKLIHKDIVMLLRGTVGKIATFLESDVFKTGFINAQMLIIRLTDKELCDFFVLFSSSNFFSSQVETKTTGSAVRQMPASVVAEFAVPIPPLAEQHRIVAKVDELMALCDALKARLSDAQTTQIHLADAIVEQAVR